MKDEILLFTGIWMEVDIIKISYSQKKVFVVFFHELKLDFIYTNLFYILYICIHIYKRNSRRTSVHREEEKQWETGQKKVKGTDYANYNDPRLKTSQ